MLPYALPVYLTRLYLSLPRQITLTSRVISPSCCLSLHLIEWLLPTGSTPHPSGLSSKFVGTKRTSLVPPSISLDITPGFYLVVHRFWTLFLDVASSSAATTTASSAASPMPWTLLLLVHASVSSAAELLNLCHHSICVHCRDVLCH